MHKYINLELYILLWDTKILKGDQATHPPDPEVLNAVPTSKLASSVCLTRKYSPLMLKNSHWLKSKFCCIQLADLNSLEV